MFKNVRLHDAILKFYQRSQPIAFSNAETLYDDLVLLRDQILMYGDLSEAQTNYLNEFIENFDNNLSVTTEDIFATWIADGFLADFLRRTINEEVVESRDGQARLNNRLNRDFNYTKAQLDELKESDTHLIAQLSQTEQEVYRKRELEDLSPTVLSAIEGGAGAEFNLLSIPQDRSVDEIKTTFFVKSTNLFDKNKVEYDKALGWDGNTLNQPGFVTSGFIRITENERTIFANARTLMFYDAGKNYIEGTRIELTGGFAGAIVTNPEGAYWLRFNWFLSNLPVSEQQVNIGETLLPYESSWKIPKDYLQIKPVKKDELSFYVPEAIPTKNRHRVSSEIKGYYINQATGDLLANPTHSTFEIPVKGNESLTFSSHNRSFFYKNGEPIAGSGLLESKVNEPLTRVVPKEADTMKYSLVYGGTSNKNLQIESGTTSTSYVKAGFIMPDLILPGHDTESGLLLDINLPNRIYATVGEELVIYNQNILKDKESEFNIDWDCTIGKQMGDRYVVTPVSPVNVTLTLNLYHKDRLVGEKSTTIIISNKRTTPITVLEIGDSTTIASRNAFAVKQMKDKLGENLTLIGRMGTSTILYEGRGGWKAETYRTNTMYYDEPNYFYNPTKADFDFAYYMSQGGFSGVDVVILNLGINDVFGQKDNAGVETSTTLSLENTDFIINNILAYDPTIKIALNITIPPNANQDAFGNTPEVALFQTNWRAKYNNFIYASKLIEHYQGTHDLIPVHAVIDTFNNLQDHVHPTETGYYQIGNQKYNYLNSL